LQTTFSADKFQSIVTSWSQEELRYYLSHFFLDFPHVVIYTIVLVIAMIKVMSKANKINKYHWLIVPIVAGLCDIFENIFHLYMIGIREYPSTLVFISGAICWAKWILAQIALIYMFILMLVNLKKGR